MTEKRNFGRWARVVLILSLALNLLVVGVVAAGLWRMGKYHGHGERISAPALYRALPDADRRALRRQMSERFQDQGREKPTRPAESIQALADLLRSDPLDPQALAQVLDHQAQARADFHTGMREAWVAHVSEMSVQERRQYADQIEAHLARRGSKYRK